MKILTLFSILFLIFYCFEPSKAISKLDDDLLDEIERAAFLFFWEQSDPATGQINDRSLANGEPLPENPVITWMSSIAATGFGLTALGIGHNRNYRDRAEIEERVRTTLKFIDDGHLAGHRGFYYHFVNKTTGERWEKVELSSIDTSLLINGVLFARQYFENEEIKQLANSIYNKVDYSWFLNHENTISMGWYPETGDEPIERFHQDHWNRYCELLMLLLQGIGSTTHPIPASTWNSFRREKLTYEDITYITTVNPSAPIFIHQFSHAWYDFRGRRDAFTDYFENTVNATKAHKEFCLNMAKYYPSYQENFWGITASDIPNGYSAWGGPPLHGPVDGSIVPCATAGSIPFLPEDTLLVLHNIRDNYPRAWEKYGFIDVFNPLREWYHSDVIGIDVGVTMLMAENLRTGFVWEHFMKNPEVIRSMDLVGLRPYT